MLQTVKVYTAEFVAHAAEYWGYGEWSLVHLQIQALHTEALPHSKHMWQLKNLDVTQLDYVNTDKVTQKVKFTDSNETVWNNTIFVH